jgi:hypothetical protein
MSEENENPGRQNPELVEGIGYGSEPDLKQLQAYSWVKHTLGSKLQIVREALTAHGRKDSEQQCGELVVKLAEDHFTLAVLGQFKRGKSTHS